MKPGEHSGLSQRKKILYYEELFYFHYPRLKKFAYHLLDNDHEAEDLVQDVFVYVWNHFGELKNLDQISPYLFTLLKNKCLNVIKHKAVELKYQYHKMYFESEELYHISFHEKGEFVPMQEQLNDAVEELIMKMPPKCGKVFRMKWVKGLKHSEIASELSISPAMVHKHLSKGIEIARRNLNPSLFFFLIYQRN